MAKNANSTGTFRKLPSGNWQVQAMDGYREDGKKKYVYFTAPTKSEARQLLAAYQSRKNAPEEETTGCEPPQSVLLGDVADTWYEDYSTQVRASTYNTYSYTLKILKRYLGDKPIDGILPMDVNHFLDELSAVPYSRSCITKCRAMLIQVLDFAEMNQMIASNPARRAKTMRIFSESAEKKDAFTEDEVHLLLEHLPDDLLGNSIRLLLGTGMRVQELLALQPGDFAEDLSSVRIERAVQMVNGKPVLGPSKSRRSRRVIPIPEDYRAYASYLLCHGGKAFIWSSSRDNLLYSVGTFRRRFYKALEAVPGVRKLSPHCCRHTYSTLLQAKGVPIEMVARIMGHENIQTTVHYTHTQISTLAAAVAVLNR